MDFPTRFPSKSEQQASIHYIFLTSSPSCCRASLHCPFGNSDHSGVSIDVSFQLSIKQESPIHKTSVRYQHAD